MTRTAAGEAKDHVEDAKEVDGAPERRDRDHRAEQRKHDVAKARPGARAVNERRFERLFRQRAQSSEHQECNERGGVPGVNKDQRPKGERRITEPRHGAEAKERAEPVHHAKVVAEQNAKDEPDHHVGDEHRQQRQRAQHAAAAQLAVEQHRKERAEHQLHDECGKGEADR